MHCPLDPISKAEWAVVKTIQDLQMFAQACILRRSLHVSWQFMGSTSHLIAIGYSMPRVILDCGRNHCIPVVATAHLKLDNIRLVQWVLLTWQVDVQWRILCLVCWSDRTNWTYPCTPHMRHWQTSQPAECLCPNSPLTTRVKRKLFWGTRHGHQHPSKERVSAPVGKCYAV